MLSFKPQELLLNMEDFDYGKKTFMAMGLMEHISHWQTGITFTNMWLSFHRAADVVHGDPTNPLPNPILYVSWSPDGSGPS